MRRNIVPETSTTAIQLVMQLNRVNAQRFDLFDGPVEYLAPESWGRRIDTTLPDPRLERPAIWCPV